MPVESPPTALCVFCNAKPANPTAFPERDGRGFCSAECEAEAYSPHNWIHDPNDLMLSMPTKRQRTKPGTKTNAQKLRNTESTIVEVLAMQTEVQRMTMQRMDALESALAAVTERLDNWIERRGSGAAD